jgi:VanZ family protein
MVLQMKKKLLKWIPVVLWCMLIFFFSQQNGDESGNTSELVAKLFMFIGIDVNSILGGMATFIIRKGAHFTEYFILYLLTFNALGNARRFKSQLTGALMFTVFYAATDEIHQYFIPGRACALKDVLIDSSGGALAGVIMYIMHIRRVQCQ